MTTNAKTKKLRMKSNKHNLSNWDTHAHTLMIVVGRPLRQSQLHAIPALYYILFMHIFIYNVINDRIPNAIQPS